MVGHVQSMGQVVADATLGHFGQGPFGFVSAHIAGQSQAVHARDCDASGQCGIEDQRVSMSPWRFVLQNSLLNAIVVGGWVPGQGLWGQVMVG